MKISSILISISLFVCLYAGASSKLKIVQKIVSDEFKVSKVEKSYGNMYIAYMDTGDILYVDIKHKVFFYGSLLKMEGKEVVNLTKEHREKWQTVIDKKTIKKIDVSELKKIAVLDKVNNGNDKNEIIVFDSLTCPYCVKLNRFLKNNKYKINAYRIYNKSGSIEELLKTKYKVSTPSSRLEYMDSMFKKYRVSGTPNIMVLKNNKVVKVIKGANMKEIKKWIKK